MYQLGLIALFGALAYLFNEFAEASIKNEWHDTGNWLNSIKSWQNKWKLKKYRPLPYQKKWYHFGIAPSYEERYPYSSTILVAFTDGEHLFQELSKLSIIAAIFVIGWEFALAYFVGTLIGGFIKEIFIKQIN